VAGKICQGPTVARGVPTSSSTTAPAPPLAPTPPAPAPAVRPPPRFPARVSMRNVVNAGHPSVVPPRCGKLRICAFLQLQNVLDDTRGF